MKVLITDDNPDNVELLVQLLEDKYETLVSYNGQECLDLARKHKPDLILLDVMMPGLNGFEVLEIIKKYDNLKDIYVIFLTARYKDIDRVIKGLNLGAFDYITKPFDDDILLARVGVVEQIIEARESLKKTNEKLAQKNQNLQSFRTSINQIAGQLKEYGKSGEFDLPDPKELHPDTMLLVKTFQESISARNSAEEALRNREQNLSLTLNSIGDGVIATDSSGKITRMNPIAEKLTHWNFKDAVGHDLSEIFNIINAITRESIESPLKEVFKTGKTVTLSEDTTLISKNGKEYQISDSAAPILDQENNIIGIILIFNDVSEQYQMRRVISNNQKRLQLHRDQSILGVIEWDENYLVTDWNPAAKRIFGYDKKEVIGKNIINLIVPEHERDDIIRLGKELVEGKGFKRYINDNITKKGKLRICEWYNTPLMNEEGKVVGVTSLIDDITKRQQIEDNIRRHEQELDQILNNMVDAVISIDETGIIQSFNKAAEGLFLYKEKDVLGKNVKILMPEPDQGQHDGYLANYLSGSEAKIIGKGRDVKGKNKKGETFPMHLRVAELPKSPDGTRRFIGSCLDMTLQLQQDAQLRRSQKMDALGKLTGGIAHDYNNMLGIILGYSELLQNNLEENSKLYKFAREIHHAGERGAKLTNKLLTFSRNKSIEAEVINVNSLLLEEKNMLERTLTARIQLVMKLDKDVWPIYMDSGDLEDVILNMSINAMHAIEKSGQLTLTTENITLDLINARNLDIKPGDYILLSISDTGCGMNSEIQARIFDPFYSTKGDEGTGLGLSQVYGAVKRCGGAVKVYSEIDLGSKFLLYFPRYYINTDTPVKEEGVELIKFQGSETILVVDDEPAIREVNTEILTEQGYKVFCAESGDQALKILENDHVDMMLSDVIMPGMDGFQLAKIVRKQYPEIKIQLASGFDDNRHQQTDDAGLHDKILVKPFNSTTLLKRVRLLLDSGKTNNVH